MADGLKSIDSEPGQGEARRKSQGLGLPLVIAGALVLVGCVAGGYWLFVRAPAERTTKEPLPVASVTASEPVVSVVVEPAASVAAIPSAIPSAAAPAKSAAQRTPPSSSGKQAPTKQPAATAKPGEPDRGF
jgi:hypothetical protein